MHLWHCKAKPTPAVDGQLHVDQLNQVWEWQERGTGSHWRASEYKLEKTREYNVYMRAISSMEQPHVPGRFNSEWNQFHRKSFVKVSWDTASPLTGPNPWYVTDISHDDLVSTIAARTPKGPGPFFNYTDNVTLQVFEVVDHSKDAKVIAYNEMYSQMRGAKSYNRRYGRVHFNFDCDEYFRAAPGRYYNDAWTYPGAQILNTMVGMAMVPEVVQSNELIWFHSSKRGLYRHPKVGSTIHNIQLKTIWDGDLGSFRTATGVETFAISTPSFFYTEFGVPTRILDSPGRLRGTRYWYERMKGVMVYHLSYGAAPPGGKHALYVKPYGVDTLGIGQKIDSTWKVVTEYDYGQIGGEKEPRRRFINAYDAWDEWDQLHRVNIHQGMMIPPATTTSPMNIDTTDLPSYIRFYSLNVLTGLRSATYSRGLRVVRRKCNITSCLEPMVYCRPGQLP